MSRASIAALAAGVALLAACGSQAPGGAPDAASSSSAGSHPAVSPADPPPRLKVLCAAENTRSPDAVTEDDLSCADPRIRRAAVRTLARAEDSVTRDRLFLGLADIDADVVAWSAFGLGQICRADREVITQRLVMRSVTLHAEPALEPQRLDPWWAIARAIGRCGQQPGEKTLVGWLPGQRERARAAVFGLADAATHNKRLAEETAAALLRAAAGDAAHPPMPEAFAPFAQLKHAPARAKGLLLERCVEALRNASPARVLVVRALACVGSDAVDALRSVLVGTAKYAPEERAEAARSLGKIGGDKAKQALVASLDDLAPSTDPIALTALVGPGLPPLLTALEALQGLGPIGRQVPPGLKKLSELPIPPQAPAPLLRRVVLLRCAAASLIAGADATQTTLAQCDPDANGWTGSLARLAVLGRGPLKGARLTAWRAYLGEGVTPRVREAALEMTGTHGEIPEVAAVFAAALGSSEPGVVATAADQIAQHPERVFADGEGTGPKKKPKRRGKQQTDRTEPAVVPELAKALQAAIDRKYPEDALETLEQLARAAGAVRLQTARGWLQELCKSPYLTLRTEARNALQLVEDKKSACEAQDARHGEPMPELARLVSAPVTLTFVSDVGELKMTLDPEVAPLAVTRLVELSKRGFFDGMAIHRAVAGFVVQFGDRGGDGYGGADTLPLRCELSPLPFETGGVGIARSGRDTGSSQLFVTLSATPHLDGQYTLLGKAEGPWNAVVPGDRIQRVVVRP